MSPGSCKMCGGELPPNSKITRCFCDACRKARRAALDFKRSQGVGFKARKAAARRAYYRQRRDEELAKNRARYHQRGKLLKAAHQESAESGLPVETILQQWGAL